jgi:hypothetical protein
LYVHESSFRRYRADSWDFFKHPILSIVEGTLPHQISVLFQLTVNAPVAEGRAVLHLTTVRFPSQAACASPAICALYNGTGTFGLNMLGVNPYLDMQRTFDYADSKSSRLLTHMQRDTINIDLGYITSAGRNTVEARSSRVRSGLFGWPCMC